MLCNARSLLELDYLNKTTIFGATSEKDGSTQIVRALTQEQPSANVIGTVGQAEAGNPKMGKLISMLRDAPDADVIVMLDADGRVAPNLLRRVIGELYEDDGVGAVTCIFSGTPGRREIGAHLEALLINTDFAPTAMLSKFIEPTRYAFAACIAIKRNVLRAIGGIEALRDNFGDDIVLGYKVAAAGYRVRISNALVTTITEEKTLVDFLRHQIRSWRVDRRLRPISLGRILINGCFWAVMLLLFSGLHAGSVTLAALVVGVRLATSIAIIRNVLGVPLEKRDLFLIPFKDLLMAGVWGASLFGNTVRWSGRRLRLGANGKMQQVEC
jgi:ceramide glucosyltransferase